MSNKIMTGGEFFKDFTDAAKNHKGKETYKGFSESFSDTCLGIDAENPKRYMWFTGETENKTLTGSDVKDIVKNSFSNVSASLMTDVTINYDDNYQERKLVESIDKNKLSKYFSVVGFGGNSVSFDEYTWPDYSPNMSLIMSSDNHNYTAIKDWHLSGNGEDSYAMNQSNLIFPNGVNGMNNVNVTINLKFQDHNKKYKVNTNCSMNFSGNGKVENFSIFGDSVDDNCNLTFTGKTTPNFLTNVSSIGISDFKYSNVLKIKFKDCYLNTIDKGPVNLSDINEDEKSGVARVINSTMLSDITELDYHIKGDELTLTLKDGVNYQTDTTLWVEIPIQNTYLYVEICTIENIFTDDESNNTNRHCQISLFGNKGLSVGFNATEQYDSDYRGDQNYYISGGLHGDYKKYKFTPDLPVGEGGSIVKNESGSYNEFLTNEVGFFNANTDACFTVDIYAESPSKGKIGRISGVSSIITKDMISPLLNDTISLTYGIGLFD